MILKKNLNLQKFSVIFILKKWGKRKGFQLPGFKFQYFCHSGRYISPAFLYSEPKAEIQELTRMHKTAFES